MKPNLTGMGLGKMSNYTKEIDPPLEVAIKQTKRKKFKVNLKYFFFSRTSNRNATIDPFTITVVLHSSGTFVSSKMTSSWKNCDVLSTFNCSTTSIYRKGYYYHSLMPLF
jgi:hypothetical protein